MKESDQRKRQSMSSVSFKSRRMKNTVTKPSHGNRKRPASVPKKSQKKLRLNVAVFEPFSEPVGISFYKRIPSDPSGEHPAAFSLNGRHLPGELKDRKSTRLNS